MKNAILYFFELEKRHFNSKTIRNLKIDDNTTLNTDEEILNEAKRFYQALYTSNNSLCQNVSGEDLFFQQGNQCTISDDERNHCEGLLTARECLESLKNMESNKTPGTDGIPVEFYKVFWNDIKPFFLASINASHAKGLLSISQRRGLLTLIPKKDKSLCYIKNWRPILLLNCDYKIAAKSIANRIKRTLPSVINSDQTGFQKNRFIGENIMLLNSILSYTDIEKIPGLLLFIDFEKAFDTLEWSFIEKALKYYNFGDSLIVWIKLFYIDISSSIQNNGWSSDFFNLSRGVRQGCPLSPYLFILCAEILGAAVRRDTLIRGIKISDNECKISQYADDTTFILDGTRSSIERSFVLLNIFAKLSGLKVNYEKTEVLWIGSFKNRTHKLAINQNIKWSIRKVKSLGVWFSISKEEAVSLNYQEKKEKISKILNCWQLRRLTLLGKITVIKSLAASQLVYIMSSLPSSQSYLKEIHQLLYHFLWDGRGDKIERSVMLNEYKDGGLKMLDIRSFNYALKSKWVRMYLDDNNQAKWKLFFDFFFKQHDGKLLLTGNLKQADVASLNIQDSFTKEVIEIWSYLTHEENPTHFGNAPIWYNSLIRIANRPIFYSDWACAAVNQAKDLLDQKFDFLRYEEFRTRYNVNTTFLIRYFGVVAALAKLKRSFPVQVRMNPEDQLSRSQMLLSSSSFCKEAYKLIVKGITSTPDKSQSKWMADCENYENLIKWDKSCMLPFYCTKETKLQTFQFKLLHRRIATNDYLHKIGISLTDKCTFCDQNAESLIHLFWGCELVQTFWQKIQHWLIRRQIKPQDFSLTLPTCLGLVDSTEDLLLHHALLIGRYHIYSSKLKKTLPNLQVFEQTVLKCQEIEKCYAYKTHTVKNFKSKWNLFK